MKKNKRKKSMRCRQMGFESSVCATVQALLPLYRSGEEDSPAALPGLYPNTSNVVEAQRILLDAMFPGRFAADEVDVGELPMFLTQRLSETWRLLRVEVEKALPFRWRGAAARLRSSAQAREVRDVRGAADRIMGRFFERLPVVRALLVDDVKAAYDGDPAALTYAEVQLAYPGLLAMASYRLAHELYTLDVPIVPRIMSEWTHAQTGADINPGACIGCGVFIDHATGVVIGETAEIGDGVKIYQGVTLGARSFALDSNGLPVKHIKRHPTVGRGVVIYANATILGGETIIGHDSVIGANVFLMESVPPHSVVSSKHPELLIRKSKKC